LLSTTKASSKPFLFVAASPKDVEAPTNALRHSYTTMWVQYPDITSTLEPLGIPPRKGDDLRRYGTPYTIPAIRLGPLSCIMDSDAIAAALESSIPSPSLQLDHPIRATVQQLVFKVQRPVQCDIIPLLARNVIDIPSQEFFYSNREKDFGMPLDEVLEKMGGEKCYEKAREPLEEVAALLKKEEGPFFLGQEPVSLVLLGCVRCC